MVHKSNTAFLEPKMRLLCIFLVSCCLPGSMGGAIEEFQANLKTLVALANEEIFLPVPKGKFQDLVILLLKAISGVLAERLLLKLFSTLLHEVETLNITCYHLEPKVVNGCHHVPCQLERTIEGMKLSFKTNPARTHISLMEKNMDHITSTLKKTHTQPKNTRSCPMRDQSRQTALKHFRRYFQKVHENCWES